MKTIREAIAERGANWSSIFDALYWNKAEGYYFAGTDYPKVSEFVCFRDEYEKVVEQQNSCDAHKRNTALTVELNELCQQHGIGKIGDSVVPALKQYIEQNKQTIQLLERLIITEIGDFTAGLGHPGEPKTPEQIQAVLMARVQRVFADVRLQAFVDTKRQDETVSIKIKAVEDFDKFLYDTFPNEGVNYATYGYAIEEFPKMLLEQAKAGA